MNVAADPEGMADLQRLGVRTVPIVSKGDKYVSGQVLKDIAGLVGIDLSAKAELSPAQLFEKLNLVLDGAQRFLRQMPDDALDRRLPNRNRTYRELGNHVFVIPECFLGVTQGAELTYESLATPPADWMRTGDDIARYGADVQQRIKSWWETARNGPFQDKVPTYYGPQPLRDVLERTTWHSGQHVRQLMMILRDMGIEPDRPLTDADFAGLPMPEKVWDD